MGFSLRLSALNENMIIVLIFNILYYTVLYLPQELAVDGNVMKIFAGRQSSYYLYDNGRVDACGRNDVGQLGDGTFEDSDNPVSVNIPKNIPIRDLGSGPSSQSVFFIAGEDTVYAAGQNYRYQLGVDTGSPEFPMRESPVLVEFEGTPWGRNDIIKISSSGTHTVAVSCPIITASPTGYPTVTPTVSSI